jgi:phage recombination protein Bet
MTDTPVDKSLRRAQPAGGLTLAMVVEMTGYQPSEIALIARTVATDATLQELAMFLHSCRQLRLDPLLRQAHFIKRQGKGTLQVGIDGYRSLADRQGNYAGSSEPIFRGSRELKIGERTIVHPDYAQVVTRKLVQGHVATFVGEARWDEFYPGSKEGFMWHKMPHHQLAKCAEAQSLRKGWPALLGAIEMSPDLDAGSGVSVEELPQVGMPEAPIAQDAPQPRQERATPTVSMADYNRIIHGEDDPGAASTPEPSASQDDADGAVSTDRSSS